VGPQIAAQVQLFNSNPTGRRQKEKRLRPMMEEGGISDCGNAQNCVKVCPKNIPLTDAIAATGRDVTIQAFEDMFNLPGRE
jgi:succinate dehydrogenase / fumarate reductase, iron-sulfur subunit